MNPKLLSEKQRLDNLFEKFKDLTNDEEVAAHWSRYLCVLVSGFLENAIRVLAASYATARSHPNVANYVARHISSATNLNQERIGQVLGSFSQEWELLFRTSITDEQKDAIDSVIANRHNIAHGRSVGVSPARIKEYYSQVLVVVEMLENDCFSS